MITQQSLDLMAKAAELFVQEFTLRASLVMKESKRKRLSKQDLTVVRKRMPCLQVNDDVSPLELESLWRLI